MPRKRRRVLRSIGALGTTAVLAGCLGDGSSPGTDPDEETEPADGTEPADDTTAGDGGAQAEFPSYDWSQLDGVDPVPATTITMTGFTFEPLVASMPPGTELTVTNEDSASHTITVPGIDVKETLSAGGSASFTVEATGTFDYVCEFHAPDMLGRLVVSEDAQTTTDAGMAGPTVQVREHAELGDVLVDAEGMTLYMFDSDTQGAGESTCTDGCASAWPPLTVDGDPSAGDGVTADLSTFERADGTTQVAADGWPLYYFGSDESPGDAKGQGASDVWWVLRPDGTPVRGDVATETATETGGYY